MDKNHIEKKDIADTEIIARRKELGILEYVPFHFYEKTAFTGSVYDANPDIAFCTITILREYAANVTVKTPTPKKQNESNVKYMPWRKLWHEHFTQMKKKQST